MPYIPAESIAPASMRPVLRRHHLLNAFGWHLDLILYLLTAYVVFYIWRRRVWHAFFPVLAFNGGSPDRVRFAPMQHRHCPIGRWGEEGDPCPSDYDTLWFRIAREEAVLFADSKRVLPDLASTLMVQKLMSQLLVLHPCCVRFE